MSRRDVIYIEMTPRSPTAARPSMQAAAAPDFTASRRASGPQTRLVRQQGREQAPVFFPDPAA